MSDWTPTENDARAEYLNYRAPHNFDKLGPLRLPLQRPTRAMDAAISSEAPVKERVHFLLIERQHGKQDGEPAVRIVGKINGEGQEIIFDMPERIQRSD